MEWSTVWKTDVTLKLYIQFRAVILSNVEYLSPSELNTLTKYSVSSSIHSSRLDSTQDSISRTFWMRPWISGRERGADTMTPLTPRAAGGGSPWTQAKPAQQQCQRKWCPRSRKFCVFTSIGSADGKFERLSNQKLGATGRNVNSEGGIYYDDYQGQK